MRTEVVLTAGPDDGPHHDHDGCRCQTCRRRAALKGEGIVPRVDAITARGWPNPASHGTPDIPPRHPETGRFMAERHPVHDGRNVKGEFIEDGVYDHD